MSRLTLKEVVVDYLAKSSLHGVRFIVDQHNSRLERVFWVMCVIASWIASGLLMHSSWDAFQNNAISFVVETSYRDWDTDFPAIVVCETKNVDRLQELADEIWGEHDFTLEEVLNEIVFFRGESYHTIEECADKTDNSQCITSNFTHFSRIGRSRCEQTLSNCTWKGEQFECCAYFAPMETELGVCFALNSIQFLPYLTSDWKGRKLNMVSNRYMGLGRLTMDVLTEANIYTLGAEDVPNLVTAKSEFFTVGPFIAYRRQLSVRNIENDPQTRSVSVAQRSCRFTDENDLTVHQHYSYSACSVECRKRRQLQICNCTSHLMPNTPAALHCGMTGLQCLNDNYEELSVVIASWTHNRKGLVCDCLPSCTEIDISVVHDAQLTLDDSDDQLPPVATVDIALSALPTERYKRNVVRGTLDLVVSMGGATGLFIGASLLSFVELLYYFTVRPYGTFLMRRSEAARLVIGDAASARQ